MPRGLERFGLRSFDKVGGDVAVNIAESNIRIAPDLLSITDDFELGPQGPSIDDLASSLFERGVVDLMSDDPLAVLASMQPSHSLSVDGTDVTDETVLPFQKNFSLSAAGPKEPTLSDRLHGLDDPENWSINRWRSAIDEAACLDPNAVTIRVFLERGVNQPKILTFKIPSTLFEGLNRRDLIRFITASIYNDVVAEGASGIFFFMDDKAEEMRLASAVREEIVQRYARIDVYGNFGEPIQVADSSKMAVGLQKELTPPLNINPEFERGRVFVGVDVGGTYIKVVIIHDGKVVHKFMEEVGRSEGGVYLKEQIVAQATTARQWVQRHLGVGIDSLGLTFPAPVKLGRDGKFRVVRLTNFERHWAAARGGSNAFGKDYEEIDSTGDALKALGIPSVFVMNDADAFGFGEAYRMHLAGKTPEEMGIKVVLPIGTGPGYVKINRGVIENIPNQGGHSIIDLSDGASPDQGCGSLGCYGGYVPASAVALRAKKFDIDLTGRSDFVPIDFERTLRLLNDIAAKIAAAAVSIHQTTGATEVILAGGISSGATGQMLAEKANHAIRTNDPGFFNQVRVVLSESDLEYGGAIGVAHYAAMNVYTAETAAPEWKNSHSLPNTLIGKDLIDPLFDSMVMEGKVPLILTTRELDDYISGMNSHHWFARAKQCGHVAHVEDFQNPRDLVAFMSSEGITTIVSIGAGVVTDWGKFASRELGVESIAVPSALSGNGMFTEKAIFYEWADGRRVRHSLETGTPDKVIIDLSLLTDLLGFKSANGIDTRAANIAGAGDILSIYIALKDWELAVAAGKERDDPVIRAQAMAIFEMVEANADEIRRNTDLGLLVLAEASAAASLLNMRFGTSRPKDGAEHLLADEIDQRTPADVPKLHGWQLAIASLIMGYLYSKADDRSAYMRIRDFVVATGLPVRPEDIGLTKEIVVAALQNISVRPDKYTYFDEYGVITPERAEEIYETVFGPRNSEIEEFRLAVARYVNNAVRAMFHHITRNVIPNLDPVKINQLIDLLLETRARGGRVIINAAGRIGEVAVFFQQKLRALGFVVDDLKEITPEFLVGPNDLVLTFSGSGSTSSVVDNVQQVAQMHEDGTLSRPMFSITATPGADLWKVGDGYHFVMEVKGRSKNATDLASAGDGARWLPLSSTFEYSTALFLEGIIEALTEGVDNPEERFNVVKDVIGQTPAGIKEELTANLQANEEVTAQFVEHLLSAVERVDKGPLKKRKRVYLFGLGQNNYVIRLFGRRLQNIGYEPYVPGPRDIISKARKDDIAIFVSNSGGRGSMMRKLATAKRIGCQTIVVTANGSSEMASGADHVVEIAPSTMTALHTAHIMTSDEEGKEARRKKRTFEIAAMFYLEGVSVALMQQLGIGPSDLEHVDSDWE